MPSDWLLIGNPAAGAGRAPTLWTRLIQSVPVAAAFPVHWTSAPGEAAELARSAAGNVTMVMAIGGDGTVNEVASGLIAAGNHETALGIIPLGTGNDTARAVGIEDPRAAWRAAETKQTERMDVIEVQCRTGPRQVTRYALVYAAAGLAAEILEQTTPRVKRWAGRRACYTIGFLRAIFGWKSREMRIRCGDRYFVGRYLVAAASNTEWVGGGMMRLSPGARCNDGRLEINLIPELSAWQAMRSFPRLYRGTHLSLKGLHYFPATVMDVEAQPNAKVQVDGDVCGETPAQFRILPGALRICRGIRNHSDRGEASLTYSA